MLIMPFYQFKTRSPPASLSFKGQATKQDTVKWSIPYTQETFEFNYQDLNDQ